MVRLTSLLHRVPVIKFRKGPGTGSSSQAPGGAPATAPQSAGAPAAAMSTSAINDFELPPKYQRRPMSQEEIDHINGGGIKDESSEILEKKNSTNDVKIIQLPCKVIIASGKKKQYAVSLNIVVQNTQNKK